MMSLVLNYSVFKNNFMDKTTKMNNENVELNDQRFTNGTPSPPKPGDIDTYTMTSSVNHIDESNVVLQKQSQNG